MFNINYNYLFLLAAGDPGRVCRRVARYVSFHWRSILRQQELSQQVNLRCTHVKCDGALLLFFFFFLHALWNPVEGTTNTGIYANIAVGVVFFFGGNTPAKYVFMPPSRFDVHIGRWLHGFVYVR